MGAFRKVNSALTKLIYVNHQLVGLRRRLCSVRSLVCLRQRTYLRAKALVESTLTVAGVFSAARRRAGLESPSVPSVTLGGLRQRYSRLKELARAKHQKVWVMITANCQKGKLLGFIFYKR
jgi:hypothetical protein